MLSFSTSGSAHHAAVDKVTAATERVRELRPALAIDGAWLYVGNRERKQILRFSLADGKADDKPFATLPDNPEFLMRVGG